MVDLKGRHVTVTVATPSFISEFNSQRELGRRADCGCASTDLRRNGGGWPRELYALLWSRSQDALHIEPLAETISTGQRFLAEDRGNDFIPIAVGSRAQCDRRAQGARELLMQRAQAAARRYGERRAEPRRANDAGGAA